MPQVSVIIPNYNHSPFLKQRIDSVLNQTFQDYELIILDDCSTDNSIAVLEKYGNHPKVTYFIINEINSGSTFKQWAKGLALAKGEFIWIAESDDYAAPNFLEKCVNILEKKKNVGLVYTDSHIIEDGKIIGSFKEKNKIYYPKTNWKEDHLVNGLQEIQNHLIQNCSIYNVSGVLFRRSNIEKIMSQIVKLRYAGDWLCYLLIAITSDIYYIFECLNSYRTHENNATKKSDKNYIGMYERIAVRSIIQKKTRTLNNAIYKKAKQLNLVEFRAILGGFIRGRISIPLFFKTLSQYI